MTTLRQVADAVMAKLGPSGLLLFPGGVPDDADMPRDDVGVLPYAAIWQGGGQARSGRHGGLLALADEVHLDLAIPLQVTAAAGSYDGALLAVTKVRAALTGARLFNDNRTTRLREITDPGVIRKDQDVPDDLRWYLPMQYRFTTTT